ncbi:hypothetical protein DY000_02008094 [Brassica cretica]|uniref:Uncharacterized protein n=1 Tax=Brassica cretica TaxID=69181 RepID=A0ABQ7CJ28_BRACR|nr:hypothetical protein DY000_02008094 [Brassica cretica]
MLQSDSVFSQNLTVLYKCNRNLRLLCSHAINDIQDASVGLGLQVIRLQFKEGTEYNFIRGSIEKTTVLLKIIKILDSQATVKASAGRSSEGMEKTDSTGGGGARQFTGPVMEVTTLDRGFANSTTVEH